MVEQGGILRLSVVDNKRTSLGLMTVDNMSTIANNVTKAVVGGDRDWRIRGTSDAAAINHKVPVVNEVGKETHAHDE